MDSFLQGQGMHLIRDQMRNAVRHIQQDAVTQKIELADFKTLDLMPIQEVLDTVNRRATHVRLVVRSVHEPFARDPSATDATYVKSVSDIHKQPWESIAKDYNVRSLAMDARPRMWRNNDLVPKKEGFNEARIRGLFHHEVVVPYEKALAKSFPRALWPLNAIRWIGSILECVLIRMVYAAERDDSDRVMQLAKFAWHFCSFIPLGPSKTDLDTWIILVG